MDILELFLREFVNLAMLLFEYIGVGVITFAGIQGIVNYVRRKPDTRLVLAKGLAMGLEFKLGSEILRTVIVRSLDEIYIVAGIIALRAVLTILIHWEIGNERKEEQLHQEAKESAEKAQKSRSVQEMSEHAEAAADDGAQTEDTDTAAVRPEAERTGDLVPEEGHVQAAETERAAGSQAEDTETAAEKENKKENTKE